MPERSQVEKEARDFVEGIHTTAPELTPSEVSSVAVAIALTRIAICLEKIVVLAEEESKDGSPA